jgi:hypothetical protein
MTICTETDDLTLLARVAGLEYDLNDRVEIRLRAYDLGTPNVRRLSQRAPEQHGDTDLGWRMDPRFVDLAFSIAGDDLPHYRQLRGRIMEAFYPRDNDPVQLIFDFGGGLVRALNVNVDGSLNWARRLLSYQDVSGIFKASDPRLYDPEQRTVLFSLETSGGSAEGWEIPWEIPWEVGADVLDLAVNVTYAAGSRLGAPEFPVIRITGPITNPVITNETTGEKIDLSGGAGLILTGPSEFVTVDLSGGERRDSKTVRDQDGDSVDHFLTTDSDLATFHLAPAGERLPAGNYASGINVIRVTGTGVTPETLVAMNYLDRYIGV